MTPKCFFCKEDAPIFSKQDYYCKECYWYNEANKDRDETSDKEDKDRDAGRRQSLYLSLGTLSLAIAVIITSLLPHC